jgi:DNA primase
LYFCCSKDAAKGPDLAGGLGLKGVTSEVIAEVRSRAQILDLVSEAVVLKRAGKHYKGLCPFHNEKTPSFIVNLDKGIYKCFGCGEGGDVFTFVQKVKGVEFLDSVRELAHRYGVPLIETTEERREYDKRTQMLLFYQQASEYYIRLLKQPSEGEPARQYLKERGISEEIIDRFKLGYASSAWDGLLHYLMQANKVTASSLEEAGLVRRRQDGSGHFDLFRQRLIIPICDNEGRVIAFGGRTLAGDQVKYLNSPETAVYSKGHQLFAFHQAKETIKAKDSVLVVEGYFDAITAHRSGFGNTVATLGTALTSQQAKMLVRYTESRRVYLCFDADPAGLKAVDRGIETLNEVAQGVGIDLKVVSVPGGKDPDECLKTPQGAELFTRAIEEALPIVDYQLELALRHENTQSHTGKIEAAKKVVPILSQIKNAVARGEYVRQSALKLGVREEELLSDVAQFRKENRLTSAASGSSLRNQANNAGANSIVRGKGGLVDGMVKAEQCLLALFLTNRPNYDKAYAALDDEDFITPAHKRIKDTIYAIGSHFNNLEDLEYKLRDRLAPEKEVSAALLEIILKAEEMRQRDESVEAILMDFRKRLMKEHIHRATRKLLYHCQLAQEDAQQASLQSKIRELGRLGLMLPGLEDTSAISTLKRKIEELMSPYENLAAGSER